MLLGWLVCAKRPLKWHEMQSITSFNWESASIDFDKRMLRQNVHIYVGPFVRVLDGGHINLIHSTARRFVLFSIVKHDLWPGFVEISNMIEQAHCG